ncbi:MAG: ribokinase [Alphaproteobacteria bacterium]|nr:MAG: ribokinase [Alphaproteobacteria bacterium]
MSKYTENIVVVGSINCDVTTYINEFPRPHETIVAERTTVSVGGKGLNQSVAAARAGGHVSMVACIGNDQFGAQAINYLSENGVSVEYVTCAEGVVTGTASIFVTSSGENMIAVSPGANAMLTPELVENAYDLIVAADVLIVQLEIPLASTEMALKIAKEAGVKTILNPAPANSGAINLLPLVDIVTPNETETEVLTGIYPDRAGATEKAVQIFHDLGTEGVIITKGEDGCAISIGGHRADLGTFKIDMIDPTGAGDVFNGVFAVGLARKYCHEKAARLASAAAAISVTRPMAEGAAPFAFEIEEFMARYS